MPGMKRRKPRKSSSAKRGGAPKNVDAYIAGVPEPARAMLKHMRETIRSAVPRGATETISYGIPAFRQEKVLVWFAAFAKHCSLFPTGTVIEAFRPELKDYTISKGTIQFPLDKPLPTTLITKIVKARVAQAEGTQASAG
jgi:uncharacterized protein YdhG (YjbR/CyaY superfamily)